MTGPQWPPDLAKALRELNRRGVQLWAEDGELRYRAPKGALMPEDLRNIGAAKDRIVALMTHYGGCPPDLERGCSRVPATWSQLAHWRAHRLDELPSVRQLAAAMRLTGELKVSVLRECLNMLAQRHQALRTNVAWEDGRLIQRIHAVRSIELERASLRDVPESLREAQLIGGIESLIVDPVRLADDPLCRVQLFECADREHVLAVALHHLIADGYSLNLFLRELLSAYAQLASGGRVCLPPVAMQFAEYAARQSNAHPAWLLEHGNYWAERLAGGRRLRNPACETPSPHARGWQRVDLVFNQEKKGKLAAWCRQRRTTLVMGVFTAYVALVLRWYGTSDAIVRFEADGRSSPKVQNAIGYFASPLHLRVCLLPGDTFVEMLGRVTQEYCASYQHNDASFIESQEPRQPFTGNGRFNWVPQDTGALALALASLHGKLIATPFQLENPVFRSLELDGEPSILLYDLGDRIAGGVYFPARRFGIAAMQRFARNFMEMIDSMLERPDHPVRNVSLT